MATSWWCSRLALRLADAERISVSHPPSGRRLDALIIGAHWHPEYLLYLPAQFAVFRWLFARTE